jgi:hypothetical protein
VAVSLGVLCPVAVAVAVAVAQAAIPKPGARFKGSGKLYANNAPTWHRAGNTSFALSFKVSANGRRMTGFRGAYAAYCGIRSAAVTAKFINVSRNGSFGYRFSVPTRAANRKVTGRVYVSISGRFTFPTSATLSYLVNYGGSHDRSPYSTAHPTKLGCASWVRATAHAA